MAVTFDAVGPSSAGASAVGASSLTWSHTNNGNGLVVGGAVGAVDTGMSTACTYAGVSMTAGAIVHTNDQTSGFLRVFTLLNPAAGANTVAITLTGGTGDLGGGSISVAGAGSFKAQHSAVGASAPPSATSVGSTTDGLICAFVANGQPVTSADAPSTSRYIVNINGATGAGNSAGATSPSTGSNVTTDWSVSSDWWAVIGVEVLPAAAPLDERVPDPGMFLLTHPRGRALLASRQLDVSYSPGVPTRPILVAYYKVTAVADTSTLVTPSFTPENDEIIVVKSSADHNTGAAIPTPTGGSLTYDVQQNSVGDATHDRAGLWTAQVGTSPGPMTVSQEVGVGTSAHDHTIVVERWAYAKLDATPVSVLTSGTAGAPSTTLSTEADASVVTWLNSDWNGLDGATRIFQSNAVEVEYRFRSPAGSAETSYYAYQDAATAGSQTIGLTVPGGQNWTLIGIEIQYKAPPAEGVIDLVGLGVAQAQSAENVDLVENKTLAGLNVAHAHDTENVDLVENKTLATLGVAQGQSVQNVVLVEVARDTRPRMIGQSFVPNDMSTW